MYAGQAQAFPPQEPVSTTSNLLEDEYFQLHSHFQPARIGLQAHGVLFPLLVALFPGSFCVLFHTAVNEMSSIIFFISQYMLGNKQP